MSDFAIAKSVPKIAAPEIALRHRRDFLDLRPARIWGMELERAATPEPEPEPAPILLKPVTVYISRVARIQAMTAEYYRIPVAEMKSPRRAWKIAHPRQVAMWLTRDLTQLSLPAIGRHFGRDHTTAIHAAKAVKRRMAKDPKYADLVLLLRRQIEAALAPTSPSILP